MSDRDFYAPTPSYLMSPSGTKTFWSEMRDGKSVMFQGDNALNNRLEVQAGDFAPYGWYGNDYVLYTKSGSQLYIAPVGSAFNGEHKITDYHRAQMFPGYGWGAGGAS